MVIGIFRGRMKPGCDLNAFMQLAQQMESIVTKMPGFLSAKNFASEDGETLLLTEFESLAALKAWKEHPDHLVAQQRGRDEFFAEYRSDVCELLRQSRFPAVS